MTHGTVPDKPDILRLTADEYSQIPEGKPTSLCDQPVGTRWREPVFRGERVRVLLLHGPDGPVIESYRPVVRVAAVNRLVPRAEARS